MRIIFHIDMNAFYANCEISQHPELKGKPIVISHNSKRSVVSTASYEAREFGIHSAMPLFMAKEKCPDLIVVEPHFNLYHNLSQRFFEIVYTYSKKVEIASIDECYVDMSDYFTLTHAQPYIVAKEIQDKILETLSLPCSIGISPNKFLSKMASDMKKPLGITIITQRNLKEVLWPIKVGDMYGIGKKTAPKLEEVGIKTIADIANYDNYQTIRQFLGKNTLIYYNRANGRDLSPVVYEDTDMKSIGHSTTFESDISDEDSLKEEFKKVCLTVAERASKHDMYSNCVVITLKYTRFKSVTRQMLVQEYMNDYDPKMIGKRIKETAQSKGYTAEKLSEITGNGIHTINRIYQGTSISTEYICQLSQVLGVSTDYLLLGKKDRMEEKPSREEIFQILDGLDDTKLIKLAGAAKILYDIA